jgi:hypothetical protein
MVKISTAEVPLVSVAFIYIYTHTGCGKLASFFHIALSAKKEVSLPHLVYMYMTNDYLQLAVEVSKNVSITDYFGPGD